MVGGTEEGIVEVEDGRFKKYKLLKVVAYCCDFFAFKTVIFATTQEGRLHRSLSEKFFKNKIK